MAPYTYQPDTIKLAINFRVFIASRHQFTDLILPIYTVIDYLVGLSQYEQLVYEYEKADPPYPLDWVVDKPILCTTIKYFQTTTRDLADELGVEYTISACSQSTLVAL
jgi:hypothetical protein